MDIFLRFKSKKHAEAYSLGLDLQLQKKCVMLLVEGLIFIVATIISYSLYPSAGSLSSTLLTLARCIAQILALIGMFLMRRHLQRVQRYAFVINLVLDLVLGFIPFAFYPAVGTLSVDMFSKLGVYTWAWSACSIEISMNYLLSNWWMKFAMMVIQITYFMVFVGLRDPYAVPIILMAVQAILFFLILTYFNERYERWGFFEKRKVYDNYEAIMNIFDDISQGIMIVDKGNQIFYSNRAVHLLFNNTQSQERSTLTNMFSQLQVESVFPNLDDLISAPNENEGINVKCLLIHYFSNKFELVK